MKMSLLALQLDQVFETISFNLEHNKMSTLVQLCCISVTKQYKI